MLLMSIVYVMCIIMQFSRFLWQINDDDNDYDGVLYQYYDLFIKMKERDPEPFGDNLLWLPFVNLCI